MKLEPQFAPVALAVAELAAEPSTREVWLIGSRANGTATEASDWDLLVFTDEEPRSVAAKRPNVDILRVGPSGRVLLEGMPKDFTLQFSDFEWSPVSKECAAYLGKQPIDYVELQSLDLNAPRFQRLKLKARLLWSTSYQIKEICNETGSHPADSG